MKVRNWDCKEGMRYIQWCYKGQPRYDASAVNTNKHNKERKKGKDSPPPPPTPRLRPRDYRRVKVHWEHILDSFVIHSRQNVGGRERKVKERGGVGVKRTSLHFTLLLSLWQIASYLRLHSTARKKRCETSRWYLDIFSSPPQRSNKVSFSISKGCKMILTRRNENDVHSINEASRWLRYSWIRTWRTGSSASNWGFIF